jgi:hypothetical protein
VVVPVRLTLPLVRKSSEDAVVEVLVDVEVDVDVEVASSSAAPSTAGCSGVRENVRTCSWLHK